MKSILYGVGKVFKKYESYVDWSDVIGIVDGDERKQGKVVNGLQIEAPCRIISIKYDYIVIFSDDFYDAIKEELIGELDVPLSKIVSYAFYFENYRLWSQQSKNLTVDFIKESKGSVLDTDSLGYSRFRINLRHEKCIVNYTPCKYIYQNDYYDSAVPKSFSRIMLWENFNANISNEYILQINADKVMWTLPYYYLRNENYYKQYSFLKAQYSLAEYRFLNEIVIIGSIRNEEDDECCTIFQVCHKPYNCITTDCYKTICVGNGGFDADYADSNGINISYLNDRINECTAIFWIWKNVETDYVGINHYRRIFFSNSIKERANALTSREIRQILRVENRIIVPEITRLDIPILENICMSVGEKVCYEVISKVKTYISNRQPGYLQSFLDVLEGNTMYRCNMFVASWRIFDSYCTWLFSFLVDLANEIDVSMYTIQEKRVVGFFAEVMLTVWLNNQNIETYELPISDV